MDLRGSDDELRARLSQNRRRQLRDWDTVSQTLEHDRGRLTHFLLGTYSGVLRTGGAPAARRTSRRRP